LSEIFLRLGDLQRLNGNFKLALDDYNRCLELRTEVRAAAVGA
jgi:hypothetical protein